MRERLEVLAKGLLAPVNPYFTALLGVFTFLWGLFVLCPTWDVFFRAGVYSKALGIAPEWAWGAWATVCGACILIAVYRGPIRLFTASLGFAIWHWATVAGMLWWGDWQNTAGLTYSLIGCYAIIMYLNIRVNFHKKGVKHV
jgi:hypothetical protein